MEPFILLRPSPKGLLFDRFFRRLFVFGEKSSLAPVFPRFGVSIVVSSGTRSRELPRFGAKPGLSSVGSSEEPKPYAFSCGAERMDVACFILL